LRDGVQGKGWGWLSGKGGPIPQGVGPFLRCQAFWEGRGVACCKGWGCLLGAGLVLKRQSFLGGARLVGS
jgi:hypothetical protein